ncbi:UNVERIFIED_CONTAM: hypothetical protein H355_002642 [Colinus virginianus]|nr:hypothetical protein H355_002642 [Colinus virginianus]
MRGAGLTRARSPADADVLCGTEPAAPGPGLAVLRLRLEPALRCSGPDGCSPCLRARLHVGLEPEDGDAGTAAEPRRDVTALLLLSAHGYASSRCVAVEVRASSAPPRGPLGSVRFRCFEAPLGSELHVTAYSSARGRRRLSQRQRVPDCSWPAAQAAIPQCQVPRLQVSPGLAAVLVEVQMATVGLNYTLRLYHNHSHGTGGSGHVVTASGPMNYSVPLEEVLPCLCLQVWPEIQDPLRATLCPFSHDAAAWERLWVQTQLVLHDVGQALSCSVSAPCDLPAVLVPCWSPAPAVPCQALPGLQQPVTGQVRSSGRVQLIQCLRDHQHPATLPGRADDILLMEPGGNTSLCVLQRGNCTPLASFTAVEDGHPGLLEQQLQEDVASGQCVQLWHPENSTGVTLWACPMHKYVRARWALAWLGVLVCAACILLLLLLKKEDVKGWLKSLRAGCGSKALSCAIPVLSARTGRYVVARLEPMVTSVPQVLRAAPAFVLPSEAVGFLQALSGRRGCRLEPHAAAVAERLRRALGE